MFVVIRKVWTPDPQSFTCKSNVSLSHRRRMGNLHKPSIFNLMIYRSIRKIHLTRKKYTIIRAKQNKINFRKKLYFVLSPALSAYIKDSLQWSISWLLQFEKQQNTTCKPGNPVNATRRRLGSPSTPGASSVQIGWKSPCNYFQQAPALISPHYHDSSCVLRRHVQQSVSSCTGEAVINIVCSDLWYRLHRVRIRSA